MDLQREDITDIKIHLNKSEDKGMMHAYASCVVCRALKISDMRVLLLREQFRVVFPSKPRRRTCESCLKITTVTANFCHKCGARQDPLGLLKSEEHIDGVHPINTECRELFEGMILDAFHAAVERFRANSTEEDSTDGDERSAGEGDGGVSFGEGRIEERGEGSQRSHVARTMAGSLWVSPASHAFGSGL